jgi:hypothetical protein
MLISALVIMLLAAGLATSTTDASGSRLAVGMTPNNRAVMLRLNPCGVEKVERVSLEAVELGLTLWEATALEPQSRFVYVVGQGPTTFLETVPMIAELPRGVLLEGVITTSRVQTVQFLFADLLPDLWSYDGSYYPDDVIDQAIHDSSSCPGRASSRTTGRRVTMVIGFLVAAGAGAGLLARRLVSPGR